MCAFAYLKGIAAFQLNLYKSYINQILGIKKATRR